MSTDADRIIEMVRVLEQGVHRASVNGWNDALYDLSDKISA